MTNLIFDIVRNMIVAHSIKDEYFKYYCSSKDKSGNQYIECVNGKEYLLVGENVFSREDI